MGLFPIKLMENKINQSKQRKNADPVEIEVKH